MERNNQTEKVDYAMKMLAGMAGQANLLYLAALLELEKADAVCRDLTVTAERIQSLAGQAERLGIDAGKMIEAVNDFVANLLEQAMENAAKAQQTLNSAAKVSSFVRRLFADVSEMKSE